MDRKERMDDAEEALRTAFEGMMAYMWSALPGIIQSFNANTMTCVVQPSVKGRQKQDNGTYKIVTLPLLTDVPVLFPSGGGFSLTFPINEGDECLVIFADHCIDAWWQQGGIQPPAEIRSHSLSDGFAFVGPRSQPRVLQDVSTTATQIRTDDGETVLEVSNGKIRLVADEINLHSRNKITFDAGGTGFVYQPTQIDRYEDGVPVTTHSPNPPEVPT